MEAVMRELSREEFVRAYAKRSDLSDEWAVLGFIDMGGRVLNALPCACGADGCEGWAMVAPDSVNAHLELYAPDNIRDAMSAILRAQDNET